MAVHSFSSLRTVSRSSDMVAPLSALSRPSRFALASSSTAACLAAISFASASDSRVFRTLFASVRLSWLTSNPNSSAEVMAARIESGSRDTVAVLILRTIVASPSNRSTFLLARSMCVAKVGIIFATPPPALTAASALATTALSRSTSVVPSASASSFVTTSSCWSSAISSLAASNSFTASAPSSDTSVVSSVITCDRVFQSRDCVDEITADCKDVSASSCFLRDSQNSAASTIRGSVAGISTASAFFIIADTILMDFSARAVSSSCRTLTCSSRRCSSFSASRVSFVSRESSSAAERAD
mmetsp:Transcript_96724/g.276173  ORF Transcript_96724/g.276173 Transcript_96724/m.276173 type:complete len:300 (+) Transcript_96724:1126-2025(+)